MLLIAMLSTVLAVTPADLPSAADRQKASAHVREGRRLMGNEAFAKAVEEFTAAAKLDPYLTEAHYGLGQANMALKEYEPAVRAFEKARDTFHLVATDATLRALENDDAVDARIRQLRDAIDEVRARARQQAGGQGSRQVEFRIQQWEMEIDMLQRARASSNETAPETPPALSLALGSAYFRSGRLGDAEREYRAALEVSPKMGESRSNLAVVLLMSGRPSDAREQIRMAEKTGFRVNEGLKQDIDKALAGQKN
jgi:Flp pilus assembly protein TadD